MIAESNKQFNCEGWGGKIEYHGPYNNYECDKQNRLYAINKDNKGGGDNGGKDNKLRSLIITGNPINFKIYKKNKQNININNMRICKMI